MNKILKLSFSQNKDDWEIAKVLLKKDKITKQHFYNIARYTGPRHDDNTGIEFKSPFDYIEGDGSFSLYKATHTCLSETLQDNIRKEWRAVKITHTKRGLWYKEASKSLKILMK